MSTRPFFRIGIPEVRVEDTYGLGVVPRMRKWQRRSARPYRNERHARRLNIAIKRADSEQLPRESFDAAEARNMILQDCPKFAGHFRVALSTHRAPAVDGAQIVVAFERIRGEVMCVFTGLLDASTSVRIASRICGASSGQALPTRSRCWVRLPAGTTCRPVPPPHFPFDLRPTPPPGFPSVSVTCPARLSLRQSLIDGQMSVFISPLLPHVGSPPEPTVARTRARRPRAPRERHAEASWRTSTCGKSTSVCAT